MQTFLIISASTTFLKNKISEFEKNLDISDFDLIDFSTEEKIGIDDVRTIISQSIKAPFKGKSRLTIIRNFQNSTIEAQNSLLKFLEESPDYLTIILTAPNTQNIIPTVLSRTQLIMDVTKNDFEKIDVTAILKGSLGQRMVFVQNKIKTKEDALLFLDNLTSTFEKLLYDWDGNEDFPLSHKDIAASLKKIDRARNYLDANINYKHVLDVLFIGLPQIT